MKKLIFIAALVCLASLCFGQTHTEVDVESNQTITGQKTFSATATIGPQGTATAGTTGIDSNHIMLCGSVWNGSAAVNDCWEVYVNDFSGAFSAGSNLVWNHLLPGGAGRILPFSDVVIGNSRSATALLNSNSRAFDTQGAYFEGGNQLMLWEMANTVSCDGCAFASTIFRTNYIPIFPTACAGCQAEFALGGSGVNPASGNYSGPPKWLWPALRGSSFFTGSFTHSNTALRSWNFPNASGGVILDSFGRFANGTIGAPALSWANDPLVGWYRNASGDIRWTADGVNDVLRTDSTGLSLAAGTGIQWGSGGVTSRDTGLWRTAANTFAFGNSTPGDFSGTIKAADYEGVTGAVTPAAGTFTILKGTTVNTATNCAAVGTAASPSIASCGSAAAGQFSCATNATGATCQVNTTAVTANSEIIVFESDTTTTGTRLGVTCNTGTNVLPASRLLASSVAGASFTINLGTVTTNPACFSFFLVN